MFYSRSVCFRGLCGERRKQLTTAAIKANIAPAHRHTVVPLSCITKLNNRATRVAPRFALKPGRTDHPACPSTALDGGGGHDCTVIESESPKLIPQTIIRQMIAHR
ncbi:MAG: hypothetical protein ACLU30_12210 [Odoribacter splanchnicus]